jgi:hypothetical protein
MRRSKAIRDLIREATSLLELCYHSSHSGVPRSCTPTSPLSDALAQHHLELVAFCKSSEVANALALANLATELALVRKMPTLLVITRYSPVLFAFNLLLWRAGIQPREVFDLCWTKAVFARLSAAAGTIAGAPLIVVGSPIVHISWRMLLGLPGKHRNRRIITDAGPDAIPHLQAISCAFCVPITVVSTIHRPPPPLTPL